MKVYELIYVTDKEFSLSIIYKDENKARAEMRTRNLRCGRENDIWPPYQVRERKVM